MNYGEFVEKIAEKKGISKANAKKDVEDIVEVFCKIVGKDGEEEVAISHLGKFILQEKAAKMCRNPRTGEKVENPAHYALKFKPCKELKDAIKNNI